METETKPKNPLADLARVIEYTEKQVVQLQGVFEAIVAAGPDKANVVEGLSARENYVVRAGQLSGLRLAWIILTETEWISVHPNLQVAESCPTDT